MNSPIQHWALLSSLLLFLAQAVPAQETGRGEMGEIDIILEAAGKAEKSTIENSGIPSVDRQTESRERNPFAIWNEAVVWSLPWEINREANRMAGERTYVLMVTDEENIYVSFVNFDSDPSEIRGSLTDRNAWMMDNNDAVGLMLDTYNDGRNAYLVAVNAAGVQYDAMKLDRGAQGTEDDESFNFLWESSVASFDFGYVVNITIPFDQLQIKAEGELVEMGLFPFRLQPRDFIYRYSGVRWDFDRNCYICQFPKISLQRPKTSAREGLLQTIPYLSGLAEGAGKGLDLTRHDATQNLRAGLDLKYQRTNSVLDLTLLPDFSQIETDAFQMTSNVRFLPLLEERRPFFMERADLFSLPIAETIYTRSIVDPAAGGRWTGKTDRHNWAFISVPDRTGWYIDPGPQESMLATDDRVDSWSNIFRYRYDISPEVMMGTLYSDRVTEGGYNRLFSYDGQFAVSSKHTLETQILGSWNRYPDFFVDTYGASPEKTFDYGYLLGFRRSGNQHGGIGHDYFIETRRLGDHLVTGTGVLQRTGIQQTDLNFGYNFWVNHRLVERIRPYIRSTSDWRLEDGRLLSGQNHVGLHIFGINRTYLFMRFRYDTEYVDRSVGNLRKTGDFDLFSGRFRIRSGLTPDYYAGFDFRFGDAVDFTLVEKVKRVELSLNNEFFLLQRQMEISHSLEYLRLYEDDPVQEALSQRLRIEYQVTRRAALRNIVQYRNFRFHDERYPQTLPRRTRTLQNQLLFRYRINYATALHLGGFVEFGDDLPRLNSLEVEEESQWQVFLKVAYLL